MHILITYVVVCFLACSAAIFYIKYNIKLRDCDSDLYKNYIAKHPSLYRYMRIAVPVMIAGFVMIMLNSLLGIVTTIIKEFYR